MSIASKRRWRLVNPEQSREAERLRALARRLGHWGSSLRPCASAESYARYEYSTVRMVQRICYPMVGAGSRHMTKKERAAIINARGDEKLAVLEQQQAEAQSPENMARLAEAHAADVKAVTDHTGRSCEDVNAAFVRMWNRKRWQPADVLWHLAKLDREALVR